MARSAYTSPSAFYGALKHKAQLLAADSGMSVADIMSSFYFNRLVARVFTHQPDGWVLKGGHALLMRYSTAARLSQDVDIQRASPGDIGEAVAALSAAAQVNLGDYLTFTAKRLSNHQNGEDGAKQLFNVHMGTQHVGVLRVDVVVGHLRNPGDERRTIQPLIDLNWPDDWPQARLQPIVDHLADKACALYEQHRGTPSSRYRDLADILLISQHETIDGVQAQTAIRVEAARRQLGSRADPLSMPERFEPPGPLWPHRYPDAARQVPGLKGCDTWADAAAAAEAFLSPLLSSADPGRWDPNAASWQIAGEQGLSAAAEQRLRAITEASRGRAREGAGHAATPPLDPRNAAPPRPGPQPGPAQGPSGPSW
jgi:hypothetical protein